LNPVHILINWRNGTILS